METMANQKKKKALITIETTSTNYMTAIVRFIIELAVLGIPFAFIWAAIPYESPFRIVIVIPAFLMFFCLVLFFGRCLMISDNRKKLKISSNRYKEKYRPVHVSKEDFVYLLKHADLSETLVLKSKEGKHATFELNVYEGTREFLLDDKEYKSMDSLLETLKDKGYLSGSITVCEITDHNKPQLIFNVIDSLMEKEGLPPFCR